MFSHKRFLRLLFFLLGTASSTDAFSPTSRPIVHHGRLQATKSDEAAALTEFMAKAHEEKIRAMERVENKYKAKVAELEAKVAELEGPNTALSDPSSSNSYAFPATNKLLTEKVLAYQSFISDYIVKASLEKQKAVEAAVAKTEAKYESLLNAE